MRSGPRWPRRSPDASGTTNGTLRNARPALPLSRHPVPRRCAAPRGRLDARRRRGRRALPRTDRSGVARLVLAAALAAAFARRARPPRPGAARRGEGHRRRRPRAAPAVAFGDELGAIASAIDDMAEQLRRRLAQAGDEQARLRAVLHGMVEGVLVLDREGRVMLANARLRELFGVWGERRRPPALEVIRRADVEAALARGGAHSPSRWSRELQLSSGGGAPPAAARRALPRDGHAARHGGGVPRRDARSAGSRASAATSSRTSRTSCARRSPRSGASPRRCATTKCRCEQRTPVSSR